MNPQLPKVEVGPLEGEAHEELAEAYGEPSTGEQATPQLDPAELLRVGGSVGVEAGLTNFEAVSDDKTTNDNASDDDDNAQQDDSSNPVAPTAKAAIGGVAVAQTPAIADDKDDIEKEWISKAKRIVEQTKADPFLQERAVSRLQADYMKKRFNKEIKLPEGDG